MHEQLCLVTEHRQPMDVPLDFILDMHACAFQILEKEKKEAKKQSEMRKTFLASYNYLLANS